MLYINPLFGFQEETWKKIPPKTLVVGAHMVVGYLLILAKGVRPSNYKFWGLAKVSSLVWILIKKTWALNTERPPIGNEDS